MADEIRLSGEDWQDWANQLLTLHHGPTDYQRVPDNDRGDAGIEGFSRSTGCAYQAYGVEEPISTKVRYERQRDKMTEDLGKFIKNKTLFEKLLSDKKIKRWILFVPYCDSKELIIHAATKTKEVKAANLPYVSNDFEVHVCHEEDFSTEKNKLLNNNSGALQINEDEATTETIETWAASNVGLAETLEKKIKKLPTIKSDQKRKEFKARILKWYLEGQSILKKLRRYPEIYDKVVATKSHRENYLVTASISGDAADKILTSTIQSMADELKEQIKNLHQFNSVALAHEAIADWLLRCPLDFPEVDSG